MRRALAGRRHTKPVSLDATLGGGGTEDDLTTWAGSAVLETMALPGGINDRYQAVVDVTKYLNATARSDIGGLRFRRGDGVRLAHFRTATGRILINNEFHSGKNIIQYFWDKSGAAQPGDGFPAASTVVAPLRLGLIFESGVAVDISPNPAVFTVTGTPTTTTGLHGQALQFKEGSYISTTATKLTSDARSQRAMFCLMRLSDLNNGRTIAWANWPSIQRGIQLWTKPEGLEWYVSDEASSGESFDTWLLSQPPRIGTNAIGVNWKAGVAQARLVLNDTVQTLNNTRFASAPGTIFNAATPYVVGGTVVPGFYHTGSVEALFELTGEFTSENHLLVWSLAWGNADTFWGVADRTPDNFDVPEMTGQPLTSEVSFAKKQITGLSPATPISVDGPGNPTYSIGSSSTVSADIKAKGSSDGVIGPGQWLSTFHTTPTTFSTVTESSVTIGTAQSSRKSTTLQQPPISGGSGIPSGPATYTVTSLSALKTAITNAKGGEIIEIAEGDYKSQGNLAFSNKDLRGSNQPLVIRSSRRPYRGYLSTQGGLWAHGESRWQTGSGGAEFNGGLFQNNHNIVFDGIRLWSGQTTAGNTYNADFGGCSYITFRYCKFSGYKPTTEESTWKPYVGSIKPYPNEWGLQSRGVNLGRSLTTCSYFTFQHCMFHYYSLALDFANTANCIAEDCVFTDQQSDHIRCDGRQANLIVRRCIFYRTFPQRGTNVDVDHSDAVQSTTKTQHGPVGHLYEGNIITIGDGAHGKIQGFFLEHDNWPEYPNGYSNTFRKNIIISPTQNTLIMEPADRIRIDYCTIIADMHAAQAPDSQQLIGIKGTFANSIIERCVHDTISKSTNDQVVQSTRLLRSEYEAQLVNYPVSYKKAGFPAVRILNPYTGVINTTHLGYVAPKASSRIHPNQTGYHMGASQRFQEFGVLP